MAQREILLPWNSQPQEVAGVNYEWHRLGALAFPHLPEAVSGGLPTVAGNFSIGPGPAGLAAVAPATQIPGGVWVDWPAVTITGDFSWLIYARPSTEGASGGVATHLLANAGSLLGTAMSIGASSIISTLDGNTVTLSHSATGPMVVIAVRRGNQHHVYALGASANATTGTRNGSVTGITFGRDRNVSNNLISTQSFLGAVFPRALSLDEIASLQANPWQLVAPQSIWVPGSAGGGASTITADPASFTWTGNATAIRATRRLSADATSFVLTGNAAGLLRGLKLTADAASYTWTANDATMRAQRVLAAAAASYVLTGNAAALRANRILSAASASYTWTGNAAALTYAPLGSYSISADAGAYTLTGNAAALRADRRVVAEPGIFNFTGSAAQLLRGYRLAADVQAYALTGNDATLTYSPLASYSLTAEPAAFAWTGNDAALTKSNAYSISAEAAAFAWMGRAATLTYSGAAPILHYASRSRQFYTQRDPREITTQRTHRSITP